MIKKYHDTCGEWDELYIFWSRDSNIRAAKIKVGKAGTIINRPVKKLYSLECSMTYDKFRYMRSFARSGTICTV